MQNEIFVSGMPKVSFFASRRSQLRIGYVAFNVVTRGNFLGFVLGSHMKPHDKANFLCKH